MSLKELVEGDCGGSNSLMQVASHFVQDKGLRDEGFHHPYPHQENTFANAHPDQLLGEFWEHTLGNMQQAFRMDNLLAEMRDIEAASLRPKPQQSAPISQLAQQEDASEWASQFLESGSHFENTPAENIWNNAPIMQGNTVLPRGNNNLELGFGPQWGNQFLRTTEPLLDNTQEELSNLRALSEDYSTETASKDKTLAELKASALESVNVLQRNPDMQQSKLLKFMNNVAVDGTPIVSDTEAATAQQWGAEFNTGNMVDNQWGSEYLAEAAGESSGVSRPSTSGTTTTTDKVSDEPAIWNELNRHWKEMADSLGSESIPHQWFSDFSRQQRVNEYTFSEDNPMQDEVNAFALGQEKLRQGDLPAAILYLEAAARQDPGNAEVWLSLGISLAENEQDPQAIAALGKCLAIEPKNLDALMAISICYTNEASLHDALDTLKEWILNNEKYVSSCRNAHISNPSEAPTMEIHQQVLSLYLTAARENPTHSIDPDVQNGLGVLFNLSDEYDKAVDCFKAALQVRPDDSRLWNRLGASLANGSRPEEAVDAYHRALQLSPGFVRARYNLGITCVHLGANTQAVEHFLTALNQQSAAIDGLRPHGIATPHAVKEMSDSIWYSLRVVLSVLNRSDLHQCVTNRDLATLNKEFDIS
uniref:Peroxisomal targeting signal 1 receptor n=1 Tax=Cacopsylla melanoneura TaxID=428564 RepID=A0A8D9B152_9HEMI